MLFKITIGCWSIDMFQILSVNEFPILFFQYECIWGGPSCFSSQINSRSCLSICFRSSSINSTPFPSMFRSSSVNKFQNFPVDMYQSLCLYKFQIFFPSMFQSFCMACFTPPSQSSDLSCRYSQGTGLYAVMDYVAYIPNTGPSLNRFQTYFGQEQVLARACGKNHSSVTLRVIIIDVEVRKF